VTERKNPKIKFVSFHGHSTAGSISDALGYPDEHVDFAYNNGLQGMAFTEHGNMNSVSYSFLKTKKMKKEGKDDFRILYGIEAYVHPSISSWKEEKEKIALDKKLSKQIDKTTQTLNENESETKTKQRNPLNKRGHLVLVASNEIGLKNLFTLTSLSYVGDNFYRYPRMDFEMLKKYNEGIIVSSACMGSISSIEYWENKDKGDSAVLAGMEKVFGNLQDIFGDRFYGELQWARNIDQMRINSFIVQLSKQMGFELLSTVDSHFPDPTKWKDREIYKTLGWLGKKGLAGNLELPNSLEEMDFQLYPKNGDELYSSYKNFSKELGFSFNDDLVLDSIERTYDIMCNKIDNFEINSDVKLPSFVVPPGETADSAIEKIAYQGLKQKGLHRNKEYLKRMKRELDFVKEKKFSQYFLATKSIVDLAKEEMLVGISRGSASGSILAYLLGITNIDSLKYNLPFERFLNNAGGFPDIDLDFSDNKKMKNMCIERFGKENVAFISNFNTLQPKSLIKDISKLYSVPFTEVNEVTTKMINEAKPEAKKKNEILAGAYEPSFDELKEFSPTLKRYLDKNPNIAQHVDNILDNVRNMSVHAAGLVISDELSSNMPLVARDGIYQTPWAEGQNVRHLEPLGFIKFDILGLSTLYLFERCIEKILQRKGKKNISFEDIKEFYDENLSVSKINFDDQEVYENVFHNSKWTGGIFQFSQKGVQQFCNEVKPRSIDELAAVTSIYRPGPLSSKVDKQYVKAKNNPSGVNYEHPILREVLEKNYGLLIYQEDISTLTTRLGKDISPDEGQQFRKMLTKKGLGGKEAEVKKKIKKKFITGCREKGFTEAKAEKLYQEMEYFAQYSFSLNHAVPYAMTSYQCAWLWTYYPEEWMASYLDFESEDKKEIAVNIAKSFGFKIKGIDVNTSTDKWEISEDGKTLIQPMTSVKGFGDAAFKEIQSYRPFNTIEEFLFHPYMSYSKVNKKALDVLARAGALNDLIDDRFTGMKHFWSVIAVDRPRNEKKFLQNLEKYAPEGDFTEQEKIDFITDLTGFFPLTKIVSDGMIQKLQNNGIPPISQYDPDLKYVWFIPRVVTEKMSSKGKKYFIVDVIDNTSTLTMIRCWSVREGETVEINRPYIASLDYDEQWGFSTRSVSKNFRLIG
jgi:DNA polymerase-3 subunit alpha